MRRFISTLTVLAAALGFATAIAAVSSPASANAPDAGLSSTASSMYQTNAQVAAVVVSNGVVYAGGDFTAVRPPGVASGGTGTVSRSYLAAFDASTGAVTSFNVTLNGNVRALNVSPDGNRLYIGGNFTQVNGTSRARVAAINIPSGTLDSTWNPQANSTVYAIASTSSAVYLGGLFATIRSVAHQDLASVNTTTGTLNTAFTATTDGQVSALAMAPDGSRLLVGGIYSTLAGATQASMGSVDPITGAIEPWAATNAALYQQNCHTQVLSIAVSGTTAYMGESGDQPGCFDADYAVNISDGSLLWFSSCEGGTATVAVVGDTLYKGSHNHDCAHQPGGAGGGFTGISPRDTRVVLHHLTAQSLSDGSFRHWYPDTNAGNPGNLGPKSMATDGSQLFVAGDFTTINGVPQQGLVRFAPKTGGGTAPSRPTTAPSVVGSAPGTVTVTVPAVVDTDSGTLTYSLYRDSITAPVATVTAESWSWAQPTIRFQNTGLTLNSSHKYTYAVSDGSSTTSKSPASATVVAPSTSLPSYASTVTSATPSMYWKLDDASGSTAADSSGNGNTGVYQGGVSSTSGAVDGGSGASLDGSSGFVTSANPVTMGSTWSESAWFKTSSVLGGDILGFSDSQTGSGSTSDYTIRLDNDGQVVSYINNGTYQAPTGMPGPPPPLVTTIRSPRSYNDGHWHQVVVTYDGSTAYMYIDGSQVGSVAEADTPFSGYWQAGYTDLTQANDVFAQAFFTTQLGQTSPTSYYLNGSIDEVAVYNSTLSATQVAAQWASGATAG